MKHILGSLTIEAIDTYVRVTVDNWCGVAGNKRIACTEQECPTALDVAELVARLRELQIGWLDNATLQACGRAALEARNNKLASSLMI